MVEFKNIGTINNIEESISSSIVNNINNMELDILNNSNVINEDNKCPKIMNDATNSVLNCPICYESEGKQFLLSKCGHLLCQECWNCTLDIKLECPLCKAKVRHKTLRKLYKN